MNYKYLLKLPFHDKLLSDLSKELTENNPPKFKKNENTSKWRLFSSGIEITFKKSEDIEDADTAYPEGTPLVTSIVFYMRRLNGYEIFEEDLPFAINRLDSKEALEAKLGEAEFSNDYVRIFRWRIDNIWLFLQFSKELSLSTVSIQVPD